MNNLSSYCGLTDSRMRASEKDLPVLEEKNKEPDINNEPQVAETFEEPAEEPIYATVIRP